MKTFFSIFALVFAIFIASVFALAQSGAYSKDAVFTQAYPGETLHFTCQPDSVAKDTSRAFSIGRYITEDRDMSANPIYAQRTISSVLGAVKVTTFIDGSFNGTTWFACDTLGTDVATETATVVTIDLNGKRFPKYRMRSNNIATGRPDTICDWILYMLP